jgi:peptide/nickel transport system substrate-binding protein
MKIQKFLVPILVVIMLAGCVVAQPVAAPTEAPAAATQLPTMAPPAPTAAQAPAETPAQPPAEAPAAAEREPTGEIVIRQPTDIVEVDPHRTLWSSDSSFHFAIFDSLVQRETETMNYVPVLAKSYENVSPTEWVFELQEGVKFHNGEPFNAEVVKWNVERAMDPNEKRDPKYKVFAGAEVLDEYTVKIMTVDPDPTFLGLLPRFYILPPQYMEEVGYEGFVEKPVGTGPYKFVERVRDDHITLEANTEYWRGMPAIKTVVWKIIPEDSTALSALMAGEVDVLAKLSPDDVEVVESNPDLYVASTISARGLVGHFYPDSPEGTGEPLKDVRVRQALEMGIDVQSYIDNILGGYAQRVSTYLPPITFAYDASLEPYPYDPEQAKELLAEAGYPDGFELKMDVPSTFIVPKVMEVAQAMAADLEKIGVKLIIRPVELGTMIKYRDEKTIAPTFLWSWGGDTFDPFQYYQVLQCGHPWSFWCDEKMDELYDAGMATMDQNERAKIYKEMQAYVKEQAPMWFLYNGEDLYAANKRVNFTPRPDERILVWEMSWNE